MKNGAALVVVVLAVLSGGCASLTRPDLERLYAGSRGTGDQPPVILIPGLMGTKLRDPASQVEIWPGALTDLFFSDFGRLALRVDPQTLKPLPDGLELSGITDRIAGRNFYRSILQTLERAGGYRYTEPGRPVSPGQRRYYLFLYDWRRDNVEAARGLSRLIEQIRRDHGDPDLEVDIVAHSMGGLIARYYLRYGEQDVLDDNAFPVNMHGRDRVRRLVLLGTPSLGSVEAMKSFIEGRRMGIKTIPNDVLLTMPSLYQLFPHALSEWLLTADGLPLERDQFDVEIWRRFQWSVFDPQVRGRLVDAFGDSGEVDRHLDTLERYFEKHLERARRFVWSLTVPLQDPLPLIVFGGDCELTPARLVVEEVAGESVLRMWPQEVAGPRAGVDYDRLMLEPGDGLVTKASLLGRTALDPTVQRHKYSFFPLDYSFFLCEEHDTLAENPSFQDNLLHALLTSDQRY